MLTNKTVLVSLIGKGTAIKNSKGYTKTKYYFDETQDTIHTSFFGSALYKVLSKQGYDIDKWLIFGTIVFGNRKVQLLAIKNTRPALDFFTSLGS